ncbi:MAG TPA: UDP-2,3-diacylglucosamine diphosphatase [Gemmatimonadaceae bacterium]|nr:UDP-2,3-diacylglucosamine diphosphatase [Gemmatimonadaceae bacterium]
MLRAPCYVISDTHLGARSTELERSVVGFLQHLRGRARSLLINGDLFDFWFEWKHVIPRGHFRTLAALAELCDSGVDVLMIAGNHDCWGGSVLTAEVGLTYHVGPWHGELGGWQSLVEHGDGLRAQEDRRYRALRGVLRHPASVRAFRWLHPDWGSALAHGSSDTSRTHRARDGGRGLRAVAVEAVRMHPETELVIYGHSHVPALERVGARGVYANAGSWLEAPTYLVITPQQAQLRTWTGGEDDPVLEVIEHTAESH